VGHHSCWRYSAIGKQTHADDQLCCAKALCTAQMVIRVHIIIRLQSIQSSKTHAPSRVMMSRLRSIFNSSVCRYAITPLQFHMGYTEDFLQFFTPRTSIIRKIASLLSAGEGTASPPYSPTWVVPLYEANELESHTGAP
jgi:hypothetical protein